MTAEPTGPTSLEGRQQRREQRRDAKAPARPMPDEKLPQELFRTVTKARHRFDPKRETSEKFRGKKKNTWFAIFGCWFWPLATRPSPFGGKRSHSRFGAHLGRYILACTDLVAAFPICGPQPRLAPIISTLMLSFGWFLHLSS